MGTAQNQTEASSAAEICPKQRLGWCLRQSGFDAEREAHFGSIFALANGNLGVRGGHVQSERSGGCFLSGVWRRAPIHYHERFSGFAASTETRVPVADGSVIALVLNGRRLHPGDPECAEFTRELDMHQGLLRCRITWCWERGRTLTVDVERLVSLCRPELLAIRMRAHSTGIEGSLVLESAIQGNREAPAQGDDPRIGVGTGETLRWLESHADSTGARAIQSSVDGEVLVACAQMHRMRGPAGSPAQVLRQDRSIAQSHRWTLSPDAGLELEKFVGWRMDRDADHGLKSRNENLFSHLQVNLEDAADQGFEALAEEQRKNLEKFWAGAEIAIDGDADSELALRYSLFQLFQSASRDSRYGTGAKGLTGDGYEGHCFWDSEAFMLPVLSATAPDLARKALAFRYRTLDGARQHASEMNHARGALYPWRTISGDECSSYFPGGSAQYHINAAIAWAIRVYHSATNDDSFLLDMGAEVLIETARVWLEVGTFSARHGGRFVICGVTGPDEYSALVDNNFYTNHMAAAHLRYAAEIWGWLADQHSERAAELSRLIALDPGEVALWREAAERIYLPFDEVLGIPAQCDGFLDKPMWNFAETPASHYPLLLHYHPLTLYRHQICKQADVVQALVMDGRGIERAIRRRCHDYYAAITTHDSTLSAAPFSILAAELDISEQAMTGMEETLRVDLDNLHGNTDHGLHMAAMGGSWLCLVRGLAGLRMLHPLPSLEPKLPACWRGYYLTLLWRGRRIRLEVGDGQARYSLLEGPALTLLHHGAKLTLKPDLAAVAPLPDSALWPLFATDRLIEATVFDLDGVLTDTAEMHFQAWLRLATELGIEFNRDINRRLKGVDRMRSLEILLERHDRAVSESERHQLAARKNSYYREALKQITAADLLPGALSALDAVREAGMGIALASASRNAPYLLDLLGIADRFDFIADPATIEHGKPDPAIFLAAAAGLGIDPRACLGIEDAAAGIDAIKAADMLALGIGSRRELRRADAVLRGLDQFRIETLVPNRPGALRSTDSAPTGSSATS